MKQTINGYIVCEHDKFSGKLRFDFMSFKPSATLWPDTVIVAPHEIVADIPDGFSPIGTLVANLEEQKRLKRLALAAELAKIDEQISKLTCLTNEVTA